MIERDTVRETDRVRDRNFRVREIDRKGKQRKSERGRLRLMEYCPFCRRSSVQSKDFGTKRRARKYQQ